MVRTKAAPSRESPAVPSCPRSGDRAARSQARGRSARGQAGNTFGLVASDREALTDVLGADMLGETASLVDRVAEVSKDRTLAKDENKAKTTSQNSAVRRAEVWRRRAMRSGNILKRRGVTDARASRTTATSSSRATPTR